MAEPLGPQFRLTPAHLRLLRRLRVVWKGDSATFGAPAVDPAGPLGTGAPVDDVIRLIPVIAPERKADTEEARREYAGNLWVEMLFVVQIAVQHLDFAVDPGLWQRDDSMSPPLWQNVGE